MFCSRLLGSGYGSGGGMFLMMAFSLLIFLSLIFLAFKLVKVNSPSSLSNNSALVILNERYANDKINEEEYTKKKIILSKRN